MKLQNYLQTIRIHLIQTHATLLNWFDVEQGLLQYRPKNGGWTIFEILEHIALTSHFLLILIDKGSAKALKNVKNIDLNLALTNFHYQLEAFDTIGIAKAFPWPRPNHMVPKGEQTAIEIKAQLITQLQRCLAQLDLLAQGEGLRYSTTMSVNNLGKINVYEYIYFLG